MGAAVIHIMGDIVQSVGVIIAGLCIWLQPLDLGVTVVQSVNATGGVAQIEISNWCYADPICTILFTCLVIGTTIGTVQSIISSILLSYPPHVSAADLKKAI